MGLVTEEIPLPPSPSNLDERHSTR
ncbi:hypothetical protein CGLO_05190 [Colletotrichum gloeosporioides Cg-14]|uniref:Uncharacterized protein n=1 Tax=Colletotrichum gloeosporioides (strain Cg-14) TaxID=1237896 RepID=T0KS25_COLGC|nr:hypothetical protein CGLO_05190 [Colletotrichum gloeosporioides Cg-14]